VLIENSFAVSADPDRVYRFLQDPRNVVACLPGAELVEDLGDNSYRGRVRIKIGPVMAAYTGVATITRQDPAERLTVLLAEGRDARGNGAAKATATMQVFGNDRGNGSTVDLKTELAVSGKLAQFGRSVMSDVSSRMVSEMASRVRDMIEADAQASAAAAPKDDALKAGGIFWTVLAGFFRRLFGRDRAKDRARHGV
jgi:carbon monoxide dehydrogenase subunit G